MALLRLIAEGVGPFKHLDLDFSDGNGQPHPGPHILAGVNGSGKSTVLKTIAWVLDGGVRGFDNEQLQQLAEGYTNTRAMVLTHRAGGPVVARAIKLRGDFESLRHWAIQLDRRLISAEVSPVQSHTQHERMGLTAELPRRPGDRSRVGSTADASWLVAAYAPAMRLAFLRSPDLSSVLPSPHHNSLAFESTIQNAEVQAWLIGLYSRRAIARDRSEPSEGFDRTLSNFDSALSELYGEEIQFDVDIAPQFLPKLKFRSHRLNFAQLPGGVRGTIGWIADFMMRRELSAAGDPGVLLLDEIDAHMHPQWQRRMLPAMRSALPGTQIIATSHSPFVISSCPGARIHVFDLDSNTIATNRPPLDSPIGEDVRTTLAEIFGVDSRFDIQTERELDEWNSLKREAVRRRLGPKEKTRLAELQTALGARSEELRSLVGEKPKLADAFIASMEKPRRVSARRR